VSDTPRVELEAVLKPLLPDDWRIVHSERAVDITGTTLFLKQSKLRRRPWPAPACWRSSSTWCSPPT
jgi:hypothetical protein